MQKTDLTFIGKLSSNGRVVIPYEVREALELGDGDIIEMKITRILKRSDSSMQVFPGKGDDSNLKEEEVVEE